MLWLSMVGAAADAMNSTYIGVGDKAKIHTYEYGYVQYGTYHTTHIP